MDLNDLVNVVGNVGFPVVMCSYLLMRLEKEIHSLSSSIMQLTTLIQTNG